MNIPILLNVTDRNVLIVGLGKVGVRRLRTLCQYPCKVYAIGRLEDENCPQGVTLLADRYEAKYLSGMHLVVAATDDRTTNDAVVADCREKNILVNRVDNPEDCDFIFPSVVRRGDLSIAVCTEGASPGLTKKIKNEIETRYGCDYARRLSLMRTIREIILETEKDPMLKRQKLQALVEMSEEDLQIEKEKYENYRRLQGQ